MTVCFCCCLLFMYFINIFHFGTLVPFPFQLVWCTTWARGRTGAPSLSTCCLCWPKRSSTEESSRVKPARHTGQPQGDAFNLGVVQFAVSDLEPCISPCYAFYFPQAGLSSLSVSLFSPPEALWAEAEPGRPRRDRWPPRWGSEIQL